MICPRCESFAALVGELTLDRDHLRNELNKRKGDIVTTNNPSQPGMVSVHGMSEGVSVEQLANLIRKADDATNLNRQLLNALYAVRSDCGPQYEGMPHKLSMRVRATVDVAIGAAERAGVRIIDSPPSAQEQPASTPATKGEP